MKKVLIIANLFYASPRIPGLVKYLPEFGWQPIILTTSLGERPDERFGPPNDFRKNYRVIETPGPTKDVGTRVKKRMRSKKYRVVRPLLKFLYRRYSEIVHYPDEEKGWKPLAVEAANELLQKEEVDAIISSSSPATCHLIAEEIKNKYKIPWVADFRDLWTQNHNYPYSILRKIFEKRLEVETLSTSDALVTTSQPLAEELSILHKKKVYAITNGFDPDEVSNGMSDLTSKFTTTYTGQIYKKQDPSKLLSALKDLISDGTINPNEVEVRFYGPENESLVEETKKYGLGAIVKQHGVITRHDSFERQRESQLLFQINWEDPEKKGLYSGKIFEYLAAQRPILATGDNDTVKKLIEETRSGIYCPNTEDIKKALSESYLEYKSTGAVTYHGSIDKINKYSYREMARGFADILDTISAAGG
ncbi:MAG: glycosyltransferase [Candidatus Bathyarchaeia archaeon]